MPFERRQFWTVEFIERSHLMIDIKMENVPGQTAELAEQNARSALAKDLSFDCIACFDPLED